MNIEKKLEVLRDSAMAEAREKGNVITKQHEDALDSVFKQHHDEALLQKETRIKAEKVAAHQQLNMASSKAQLELRRELGKTQKILKKQLFEEVRDLLNDYMKTPAYEDLLVRYITAAAKFARGSAMTIYINPSDEGKKSVLEDRTGMTLSVSKEDFIGGIRSVIHERNILIDHTFKDEIDEEYAEFAFKGGAGIE